MQKQGSYCQAGFGAGSSRATSCRAHAGEFHPHCCPESKQGRKVKASTKGETKANGTDDVCNFLPNSGPKRSLRDPSVPRETNQHIQTWKKNVGALP